MSWRAAYQWLELFQFMLGITLEVRGRDRRGNATVFTYASDR
jgi:hypothetical protein